MPKSCGGLTHHGRARTEVQKLGDEGVHVKTHDLGCFQQKRLKAAEGGELYYTVRAGQGLQQQGKQLRGHREGRHDHICDEPAFPPPHHGWGQWLSPRLRLCRAYRGQLWQKHRLRQPIEYMRQPLQVIWLHICKNMERLREKLVSDIELGNSTPISDEAGKGWEKTPQILKLRTGKTGSSKEKSGTRIWKFSLLGTDDTTALKKHSGPKLF